MLEVLNVKISLKCHVFRVRKGEELGEEFVQLSILGLHIGDSGAYTCKVGSYSNSSATVHVVNGMFSYKRKVLQ